VGKFFAGCHKNATEGNCFLPKQRFSNPVSVWCMRFSPHALHGSMLKAPRCGCGGMQRLILFSHQKTARPALGEENKTETPIKLTFAQ
jgi:hypothetical protein